jgi:glycosyltransferase involved in cell wall biosynthesis
MPTPLISVTLPNYNYGRFLTEALQSVLSQSYGNLEVLFVDDGSTDGSREIAERFAREDRRIKPVYFEKNQGALVAHANTWNRVTGEIVYQFSSDDNVHDPDFFRLGVEAMAAHPQAAGFFGAAAMISTETGQVIGEMGNAKPDGFIAPRPFLKGFLGQGFFVPGISSLWRKRAIDGLGGYDYRLGPQTDYFINHALPAKSGVVFIPRHFANARVSEARKSFSSNTTAQDELRRLALFAGKMKEIARGLGNFEVEWTKWRQDRSNELIQKYGRAALGQAAGPAA